MVEAGEVIYSSETQCVIFKNMPTPEQQREYTRLSGLLMAIGQRHYKELPKGTVSLSLTLGGSKIVVEAYDKLGKQIGTVPNETTSSVLRSDLELTFTKETFSDDAIVVIVSNPMIISSH
jgi:hypothetical protein